MVTHNGRGESISLDPTHPISTDTYPVEITLGGNQFCVPRNWIRYGAKGAYDAVYLRLSTTFPDLMGVTADNFSLLASEPVRVRKEWEHKVIEIGRVAQGSLTQWRTRQWIEVTEEEAECLGYVHPPKRVRLKTEDALVVGQNDHGGIIGWSDMIEIAPGAYFMCTYGTPLLKQWKEVHERLTDKLLAFLACDGL